MYFDFENTARHFRLKPGPQQDIKLARMNKDQPPQHHLSAQHKEATTCTCVYSTHFPVHKVLHKTCQSTTQQLTNESGPSVECSELPGEWTRPLVTGRLQGCSLHLFHHTYFIASCNHSAKVTQRIKSVYVHMYHNVDYCLTKNSGFYAHACSRMLIFMLLQFCT